MEVKVSRPLISSGSLVLRPFEQSDEAAAAAAHAELAAEDFTFLHAHRDGELWTAYLARLELLRTGADLPDGWVPETLLAAEVGGDLVGRASIRHWLNSWLEQWGGHIGYCVRPNFRRRGYATEILRQSLQIARAIGLDRALITCDEDNVASATVIERCGGLLENIVSAETGSGSKRRYWVDLAYLGVHPAAGGEAGASTSRSGQ